MSDTGEVAHVARWQRFDFDGGEGSDASKDEETPRALKDVYKNPGEVVPEEDLQ